MRTGNSKSKRTKTTKGKSDENMVPKGDRFPKVNISKALKDINDLSEINIDPKTKKFKNVKGSMNYKGMSYVFFKNGEAIQLKQK